MINNQKESWGITMNKFLDYLERNQPEYCFRIKCLDDITGIQDELEKFLSRYKLKDIGKIKKTIFHKRSLDFPEHENVEIFFVDIATSLPVAPNVLAKQLSEKFYIDGKRIVVRNPNEPVESYNETQEQMYEDEEKGVEHDPLLSTDPAYPEAPESVTLYGDKYNETYLETINKMRAKEKKDHIEIVENPLSYKETREFKNPDNFNAKIKDAPKVNKLKAKLHMVPFTVKEADLKKAKLNSKYSKSENPK